MAMRFVLWNMSYLVCEYNRQGFTLNALVVLLHDVVVEFNGYVTVS